MFGFLQNQYEQIGEMNRKYFEESLKRNKELQDARAKLEESKSEIRKMKIDILKNGNKEDKINLLIEERLQDLEEEERRMPCNYNAKISKLLIECFCK